MTGPNHTSPPAMANIIRVSVVQAATAAYSLPETLDKLERLTRLAKERDGAQLAVFPEALYVASRFHDLPDTDCELSL